MRHRNEANHVLKPTELMVHFFLINQNMDRKPFLELKQQFLSISIRFFWTSQSLKLLDSEELSHF